MERAANTAKVLFIHGYELHFEKYDLLGNAVPAEEVNTLFIEVPKAYTPLGHLIGTKSFAYRLHRLGITPDIADPADTVCSIGYNPIEKKWYGWNSVGLVGFAVNDMKFDPDFVPSGEIDYAQHGTDPILSEAEAQQSAIDFAQWDGS